MSVAEYPTISSSQRRADEWIPEACERFSQATGWPLRFMPARHRLDRLERRCEFERDEENGWTIEVREAQTTFGQLSLGVPELEFEDHSFEAVRELAELFGAMLARNLAATRLLETRTNELSTLVELGLSAPKETELLGTLKQLLRASLQLTGFRSACFFLLEPRTDELRLKVAHHLEPREIPCPVRALKDAPPDLEALLEGQVTVLRRGPYGQPEWLPNDVSLGLCLPVQAASGPMGTLWLFDRRLRSFADRELPVLEALCSQMALILERVVLQRESATQKRVQQDLRTLADARRDQSPIQKLRCGQIDVAWQASNRYEIGGDLCAAQRLAEGEFAVMIGDATGDGLTAAMTMTAAHGAIEALLSGCDGESPRMNSVLAQVSHAVVRTCRLQHFMSLLLGTINSRTLKLTYSNAGHPSPLLLRGGEVYALDERGILLGVIEDAVYSEAVCVLQPRDIVIFFSDGISEARNRQREFFGTAGILQSVCISDGLGVEAIRFDAAAIVQQIWTQLASFAVPGEADDRSLMCVVVGD